MTAPPALLEKLNKDGTYRSFAGNTIICHIDQTSETFKVLLAIHQDLKQHSFNAKLSLLPPSSFHMTIFGGANDLHRRASAWPDGVPFDVTIEECHQQLQKRLQGFQLGFTPPIRMKVSDEDVRENEMALRLELQPLDDAENARLRGLRDRLSAILGIRTPDHEAYGFHISLAYVIGTMTDEELSDYRKAYASWRDMVASLSPMIELGAPEFCVFENMLRFNRRLYLGDQAAP